MKTYIIILLIAGLFVTATGQNPFIVRGIGGGGAFFCPSINPLNVNEMYVVSDMSGVYHSTDFGLSWETLPFYELQAHNFSMIRFTSSPLIRYALSNNALQQPVISQDGGNSWNPLPGNPNDYEMLYSLQVDFGMPNRVVISDYSHIYYSSDYGNTFSLIHSAGHSMEGALVAGSFFDGDDIFLATNDGLLTSHDGGSSFSIEPTPGIPVNERILSFAAGRENDTLRFLCLTIDSLNTYVGITGTDFWDIMRGVYTLDYGQGGWQPRLNGIDIGNDYPMWAGMAENDIHTMYLAGGTPIETPIILKSTDAGGNWNHTLLTPDNQNIYTGYAGSGGDMGWWYGGAPLGLAVGRNDANRLVFTDLGFVHTSTDGGNLWYQAYVNPSDQHPPGALTPKYQYYHGIGLENTTCWQTFWADTGDVFAAFSDIRGIRSQDGGESWSFDYTGHTQNTMYWMVKHPQNGKLYAATSTIHDMYQSTRLADNILDSPNALGKIIFSSDKGATWQEIHNFQRPVYFLALDPANSNRMYASVINHSQSAGGIWRCNDLQDGAASVWIKLPDPPGTEGHPAMIHVLNDGKVLCSFSGRRASNGSFTASSGVFLYDPSTNAWSDRSDAGMFYWTQDVIPDPGDTAQNTWYACVYSGWGGAPNGLGGLYRTYDRGLHWNRISNLDRVMSAAISPSFPHELYITTETEGLWVCDQPGNSAPEFRLVENYTFRQPLRVFFNPYQPLKMWVTSFGHAMEETTLPARTIQAAFTAEPVSGVYPLTVHFTDQSPTADTTFVTGWQWDFNNDGITDDTTENPSFTYSNPGIYSVSLLVEDGYSQDQCLKNNLIHVLLPPVVYVDDDNLTGIELGTSAYPYSTIQMAVDSADNGDTVKVAAGYYPGTIIIPGKTVHLRGAFPGAAPVDYENGTGGDYSTRDTIAFPSKIIGNQVNAVLTFLFTSSSGSSVDGFTLKNGRQGIVLDISQTWPYIGNILIHNNIIEYNGYSGLSGLNGIGIQAYGNNIRIEDNIIRNNRGGIGAGIYTNGLEMILSGNLIEYNAGFDYVAGGVYFGSGGRIENNIIRHNTGAQGVSWGYAGGLMISCSDTVILSYNTICYNQAPSHAGGILIDYNARVIMDHDLVYRNTSGYGSGIFVNGASWANPPLRSWLKISSSTVANNYGPGYYQGNGITLNDADALAENSIFRNNGDDFNVFQSQDSLTLKYCITSEGWAGVSLLYDDPLFADTTGDDYHELSEAGRWVPGLFGNTGGWVYDTLNSPAIDAGDPSSPWSAEPAFNGNRINVGRYGNTAEASRSIPLNGNSLQGMVVYDNVSGTPLDSCFISLIFQGDTIAGDTTDMYGNFSFFGLADGTYTLHIRCSKVWTGVNATDALTIMRHFVNLISLNGLKWLAADVDNSGYINTTDALRVAKRFVGLIDSFPAGDWVFETLSINVSGNTLKIINPRGLCNGDVNASGY
ncbi:MAG: PKD domain-containing protein [Bacteroidetes bacterium]|nr:PKD domain-containing protein [Bacteroidota bacterium]